MTYPGGGIQRMGGQAPPLDRPAEEILASVRRVTAPQQPIPRRPMTEEERREAETQAKEQGNVCIFCLGLHPLPSTVGCPRIATFELNGDGSLVKGTYWEGTAWAEGRVTFAADAFEKDGSEKEAGDGNQ